MIKKSTRIMALTMALVFLFASVAMAAIPNNTIIFGGKAYDLSLLNDQSMVQEILSAFVDNGNSFIYKTPAGALMDPNAQAVSKDVLPEVEYKDANKNVTRYGAGDGEPVAAGKVINSITATDTLGVVEIVVEGTTAEELQAAITSPACTVAAKAGVPNTYTVTIQNAAYDQEITLQFAAGFQLKEGVSNKVKWAAQMLEVQSVSAITKTSVKVILASAPAADLTSNDISKLPVLVNGSAVTPTAIAKDTTDATGKTYTLTIPSLDQQEGNLTVSGTAPASKVAPGSDFDFDFKAPTATVTVVDANHLKVVYSEKVSKAQAETVANNYAVRKISNNEDDAAPTAATLEADGKTVDLTLGAALVPASYVLKLNPTANANNIQDLAGNVLANGTEVAFTGTATTDTTPPQVLGASYDSANGILIVKFNEAMDGVTFNKAGFSLSNGATSVALTVNETGTWGDSNTKLTITLSPTTKASINALTGNLTLSIAANAVKDAASNGILAVSNQAVSQQTILTGAAYDQASNILTLTFSNPVKVNTFANASVTLDSTTGQARTLGANDKITTTVDGTTVSITLAKDANLDAWEGSAVTGRNVDFTTGATTDIYGVPVATTTNVPVTYTADTTAPTLLSASFNKTTKRMTLVFSEPVQVQDASGAYVPVAGNIAFTSGAFSFVQGNCEQYTGTDGAISKSTLTFVDTSNTITPDSKIYFTAAGAFKDDAGNNLAAVTSANAIPVTYIDQSAPTVDTNATHISPTSVKISFNKPVDQASAQTIANYTIYKDDNPAVTLPVTGAVLASNGTDVYLTVGTAATTGYTYKIKVSNVKDTFGNVVNSAQNTATWGPVPATGDTTAPTAGVITFTDVDSSKSITAGDTLDLKFSEPMSFDFTKVSAADFTVSNGHTLGAGAKFAYGATNDVLRITLGTAPTITWNDTLTPVANSNLKDMAGNSAAVAASDALTNPGTAPKISTISYADTNASGAVDAGDKLTITYDRNITLPNGAAALSASDFTLGGGLNFGNAPTFELVNSNQIVVTLGGTGIAVTVGTSTIDEAASVNIADEWGVTQAVADSNAAIVTSADKTNPTISSVAITKGAGNTGNTLEAGDTVTITMSEPVHKGTFTAGEFALFTGATQVTYAGSDSNVAVNGNKVTITIAATDGWVGTQLASITTFNFTGAAATVQDASGNVASPSAGFGVNVTKP